MGFTGLLSTEDAEDSLHLVPEASKANWHALFEKGGGKERRKGEEGAKNFYNVLLYSKDRKECVTFHFENHIFKSSHMK